MPTEVIMVVVVVVAVAVAVVEVEVGFRPPLRLANCFVDSWESLLDKFLFRLDDSYAYALLMFPCILILPTTCFHSHCNDCYVASLP